MRKINNQRGVGLIEVLVALLLLTIGVLGFTALQLRAVNATEEAMLRTEAMNLARDLAEKIRTNRSAFATYTANLTVAAPSSTATPACLQTNGTNPCTTATQMANYDTAQIVNKANALGMTVSLPNCQVTGSQNRQCVYVAWGNTKAINSSTDNEACTNGGAYLPQAKCVVMELY